MAISVIGGVASTGGGLTAPAGFRTVAAGVSSTGSYTTTLTAGDYYFVAPAGSTLSCNGTTYPGYIDNYGAASTSGPIPINPSGNYIRVAGTQQVTVTVGPLPVTSRLGTRAASGWAQLYNRNAIRFANSVYAFPDRTNNVVWTSADASTWTSNATTFAIGQCFMVANGVFFAGDTSNANIMYTSTNGSSWTQRTMPTANIADGKLAAVVYSNGRYVAFFRRASGNTFQVHTFTSTDAITWTYGAQLSAITFTNADAGIFVAASSTTIMVTGDGGTANTATAYSTTGTSWTANTQFAQTGNTWDAVEFVNGNFVSVIRQGSASTATIWYNSTGQNATWTSWGSFPSGLYQNDGQVTGINWDGSNFVITSSANSQNSVWTIARSANVGGGWTGSSPFGWSYSTVQFKRSIFGSMYVNNRWFFNAREFRWTYANDNQTTDVLYQQGQDQIVFMSTGAFPTLQAPGAFGLYRLGDTTTLN